MGSETSIGVSEETKALLEEDKRKGETWDARLQKLVKSSDNGKSLQPELAARLDELNEKIDRLPENLASELH